MVILALLLLVLPLAVVGQPNQVTNQPSATNGDSVHQQCEPGDSRAVCAKPMVENTKSRAYFCNKYDGLCMVWVVLKCKLGACDIKPKLRPGH